MLVKVWRKGNSSTLLVEFKLQPLWKTACRVIKKLKIELPYDPEIPLLDIYLEKIIIWKSTWTPMFIAVLFAIAKTWKHLKCPLTDEWIKKIVCVCVCVCVGILLNSKKEWNNTVCSNMDETRDYHTEVKQVTKRKTNTVWYHSYMESKIWHKWNYLRNRNKLTNIKNKLTVTKEKRG